MYVTNSNGTRIDFDIAVQLMDDDLREQLHMELAPCSEQEFFEAYAKAHKDRFGETWEPDKANPTI